MASQRDSEETINVRQISPKNEQYPFSNGISSPKKGFQHDTEVEHRDPHRQDDTPRSSRINRKSDRPDGKIELKDRDARHVLGFAYPTSKKWRILSVIFIVQCSMNFNASIYANGVPLLTEKFDISEQAARVGQMIFLISYAFGCELWAPWSEELGRWPTLQLSLLFVNSELTI